MAKKKTRYSNKLKKENNKLILILIILVILVSVFSTLLILDSVENAKKFFISKQVSEGRGEVKLTILANPDNWIPPLSGDAIAGKIGVRVIPPTQSGG